MKVVPFSQSSMWKSQRRYFEESSVRAWSDNEVPNYITSNPRMAEAYAELIWAFARDRHEINNSPEPIYILELGAGSGRFSYSLLKALTNRFDESTGSSFPFVLVMTDFIEDNITFWEQHPRLQPFFERKILDVAYFDAETDHFLYLRRSNTTLRPQSLRQPMITIANYFFDSIPQELFYFNNQQAHSIGVVSENSITGMITAKDELQNLSPAYTKKLVTYHPFNEPIQDAIFAEYKQRLDNSYVLFPQVGIACLSHLRTFTNGGLLLITADKGFHRLDDWQQRPAPDIVKHGSFSLMVNYHALKEHCERAGGMALFPKHSYEHINIGCLLYVDNPTTYRETLTTFTKVINDFGPDEFFTLKQHVEKNIEGLTVSEVFAFIRLSAFDPKLFYQLLPRLYELRESFTEYDRYMMIQITARVWDLYYPIGETINLALRIATLLSKLDFYEEASRFFALSEYISTSHEHANDESSF